jgi:IS1 family transposase
MAIGRSVESLETKNQEYKDELSRIQSLRKGLKPGRTKDLESYEKYADEIQNKWGQRSKEHYARLMLEICKPISSGELVGDRRHKYEVARKYALSALEKADEIPLDVELELTGHVVTLMIAPNAPKGQEWLESRREDVKIRLHAWKRLLDAIDPNWDPNEVILSPNAVGASMGLPSGIAPEGVKDQNVRAEYEAALQRNGEKIERYTQQNSLRKWLRRFPRRAEEYTIAAYSKPPFNIAELRQYLEKYAIDKKTQARILDVVTKNIEQAQKQPTTP